LHGKYSVSGAEISFQTDAGENDPPDGQDWQHHKLTGTYGFRVEQPDVKHANDPDRSIRPEWTLRMWQDTGIHDDTPSHARNYYPLIQFREDSVPGHDGSDCLGGQGPGQCDTGLTCAVPKKHPDLPGICYRPKDGQEGGGGGG